MIEKSIRIAWVVVQAVVVMAILLVLIAWEARQRRRLAPAATLVNPAVTEEPMIDQVHDAGPSQEQIDLDVDLARCGISTHCQWTARRKDDLLRIMRQQPWAVDQLKRRFLLSDDEIETWKAAVSTHGLDGLKNAYAPLRRAA